MMGSIGCPETSVINYQSTLRNSPEERNQDLIYITAESWNHVKKV